MVYIIYLLVITLLVVVLGCAIPMIQFFYAKREDIHSKKTDSHVTKVNFIFSRKLVDADFNSFTSNDMIRSRALISSRGWVRGPYGTVITDKDFAEKRKLEYKNELP